jgi:ATP-binding protein involved in chromosome partitioning
MLNTRRVLDAVKGVMDPELKKSLLELGMIRDVNVENGLVRLTLALTTSKCPKKMSWWRRYSECSGLCLMSRE